MRLWHEMEAAAGVRANDVTFNILFDVASKAGNFTLAEMMLREMETRGLEPDRYYHVSLINFFGLKGDTDGMRAAYKEMVEVGEMVDSVALNCIINGFLRCGDEAAAESVYRRMLQSSEHASQTSSISARPPANDYTSDKIVSRVLKMFGRMSRKQPSLRAALQSQVSILPDSRTYRILLEHYATGRGDIQRVVQLLDEMKWAGVPMDGRLYMALLRGFARHGTHIRGAWSEQRLQAVYLALIQALESGDSNVYLTKWLALWILRAFARCSSRMTVFDVYVQLKRVGNFDQTSISFLDHVTTTMMNKLQ
jgi:pentatricopeptide repeat protein